MTHDISVSVEPLYLEDKSDPGDGRYVWAYRVRIENKGRDTVQLMSRHWRITDGAGTTQEVRGDGVVGEQPVLGPGGVFEYTSGTPLPTPSGFMAGAYEMVSAKGAKFAVEIPAFSLDSPHQSMAIH